MLDFYGLSYFQLHFIFIIFYLFSTLIFNPAQSSAAAAHSAHSAHSDEARAHGKGRSKTKSKTV